MDEISIVKDGYNKAAMNYRNSKEDYLLKLDIFKQFNSNLVKEGKVLDIGCGSGYPVAQHYFEQNYDYLGIDLSEKQINLAKNQYPSQENKFKQAEMLKFSQHAKSSSFSGIIAIFSIFHLPRKYHAELFTNFSRILENSGLLLFTVAPRSEEGYETDWLSADKMYWSSFSPLWHELTISELGFELLMKMKHQKIFDGELETMWYYLYKLEK